MFSRSMRFSSLEQDNEIEYEKIRRCKLGRIVFSIPVIPGNSPADFDDALLAQTSNIGSNHDVRQVICRLIMSSLGRPEVRTL